MMNIKQLAFLFLCLSPCCMTPLAGQNAPLVWAEPSAQVMATIDIGVGKAVVADIVWGLPFPVEKYSFEQAASKIKIYNHRSGIKITNFYIRELSAERLTVAFEPLGSGEYDIYFSPLANEKKADYVFMEPDQWTKKLNLSNYPDFSSLNKYTSRTVYFQNRPTNLYDYIATDIRASMYYSSVVPPFKAYLVPWDCPLNEYDRLPDVWAEGVLGVKKKVKKGTVIPKDTITVCKGGKTLLQIGVVGIRGKECLDVSYVGVPKDVSFSALSPSFFHISEKNIKTHWTVVNAAKNAAVGDYEAFVNIKNEAGEQQKLPFVLHVTDRWKANDWAVDFISAVGAEIEKTQVHGATLGGRLPSVVSSGNDVIVGEHRIRVNRATALPAQIECHGKEIFASPVLLVFSTANGTRKISVPEVNIRREGVSSVVWQGAVDTHDMYVEVINTTNAYGVINFKAVITPKSDVVFRNISLEFDFSSELPRAGFDTQVVDEKKEYSFPSPALNAGVWVGGDSLGVCISVPHENGNAFSASAESKISLYHSSTNGVMVSTGALTGRTGQAITIECDAQLLPARYSAFEKSEVEVCELYSDIFPSVSPCNAVVIKDPFALEKEANLAMLKKWNDEGKKIYLSLDGYVLPSGSITGRILASMRYAYSQEEKGKYIRFDSTEALVMPFRNMHKTMCMPYYISGVVFSPQWYGMIDVEGYYELKKRKKTEFNLMMRGNGMGAGALRTSPWLDALLLYKNEDVKKMNEIMRLPVCIMVEKR